MSNTETIERDQPAAVEALKAEFGDFVLNTIQNRPVAAINIVRGTWGEAPLVATALLHAKVRHPQFPKHNIEAFVAYLADNAERLGGETETDLEASVLDIEGFSEGQRVLRSDEEIEEPQPEDRPVLYDQAAEEALDIDHGVLGEDDGEDADPTDFLDQHVIVQEVPVGTYGTHSALPGGAGGYGAGFVGTPEPIAVGGAISDSAVADIEAAQPLTAPDAEDEPVAIRVVLNQHDISTLRKVSRGIVKGGYSLKKPALIDALVAEQDAHPNDIDLRAILADVLKAS